jgi:hypothetical protein
MIATILTSEAKDALRKAIRGLRTRLIDDLGTATKGEYQLAVTVEKARLSAGQRARRDRLDAWLDEQVRAAGPKGGKKGDHRARAFDQAIEEAAHTFLHRLVLVRILEHHGILTPHVVTGGWRSVGYANEFLQYAGPLADDAKGYRCLLEAVFDELAFDLPGLFGNVGLTALIPILASTVRGLVEVLNDPALDTAWGDDTTLGWVFQYWNDPAREKLDAKISDGGKIEPHEIACKTQLFTERYMVEWLLHNSLGFMWLCICKKNGWTPDAERVLPELARRRIEWRGKRDAGEVAPDALMPVDEGLMEDWKYYVPQAIPSDAVDKAPKSIADLKLLDPACGSDHFLVIAFGLLARMYEEEARHRSVRWSKAEIAERIVGQNLHGIDIDARAIQIGAAVLWLKARLYAPDVRLKRMNLVAPVFCLAELPKDDPARQAFESALADMGIPRATTAGLVESLKGVEHLGSLLRIDGAIGALLEDAEKKTGPLFVHAARNEEARLKELLAEFLDAHSWQSDLGLRLEGEQLAAGMRFIELVREGRYDVVVGNPPYQAISKTANFDYVTKTYPRGKADLYAAFLERGLELCRAGGLTAMVTMQGWMFLSQFRDLRCWILEQNSLQVLADLMWCAFENMRHATVAMSVTARGLTSLPGGVAVMPTDRSEREESIPALSRKRAALLAQVGRYEFDPGAFAAIEDEPIVYWWSKEFLARYARAPKLGQRAPVRIGMKTSNNIRFVRLPHELVPQAREASSSREWAPYMQGGAGRCWIEPLSEYVFWKHHGLAIRVTLEAAYGMPPQGERHFFSPGIACTPIGTLFAARLHREPSIFSTSGTSVFPSTDQLANTLCVLNSSKSRAILQSLNPGLHFEVRDMNRVPVFDVADAKGIVSTLNAAFSVHESHREPSVEFRLPGSSPWRSAQAWAQECVDSPDDKPTRQFTPENDPPANEVRVSFAIGVAFGRFDENGGGLWSARQKTSLPAGILLVGPGDAYPDSLTHRAFGRVVTVWDEFVAESGNKAALREWLRKDFFAYHKTLYENRPIYFPLSSEKRNFVAWVSIHRWTDATLPTLLADHLIPVLRQLDAEIRDANTARASSDKKAAIAAGKAYDNAKRLRDELATFIKAVTECAERGAPQTDPDCPEREVDATFAMDLDDGVMINSAALWPLLAPQWADPKKWWKQLCLADGRKDYDWAHLAKRYFPKRVDAKCKEDPSLAVAHGCFWKYHPAKAFTWELRLKHEIGEHFTIAEPGSTEAGAKYERQQPVEAKAARDKERIRRERKSIKQDDAEDASADQGTEETDVTPMVAAAVIKEQKPRGGAIRRASGANALRASARPLRKATPTKGSTTRVEATRAKAGAR